MKKTAKLIFVIIFVFLVGGLGAIVSQCFILPKIGNSQFFSKYGFFKKFSENITIVNKTEEVIIKEENSINKIASQASASVVNIISLSEENKTPGNPFSGTKNGTGIIATSDGFIVTYRNSIFEKNSTYQVLTNSGLIFEAKLLGIDEFSNLAFLKIEASNLSTIQFANSDDFYAGKRLIVIGNSFEEYQNSYAGAILSNINKTFNISGKTLASSEKLEGVFDLDFKFKKEYLGGPVIDYNGAMVGIMGSAIIDNQETFFQIPSNIVKSSLDRAIRNELISRPYLGIYYISLTKALTLSNKIEREKGALIYSPSGKQGLAVISGSPAEKSGLKINDIVTHIDGKEINLENPLSNLLSQHKKGDSVEFSIIREKQEIKTQVQL